MSFMIAFGVASIMLTIGMIIRAKVPFFKNMLVPASVVGGLLGLLVMNSGISIGTDSEMFTVIVNYLFTLTFISIGLTSTSAPKTSGNSVGKEIAKGSMGMALIWNMLYALTPVVGAVVILLIGGYFGMSAVYGLLLPFAFTQGPGQAAAFGTVFEQQYGIENAAMVGLTFAVIGFIACFMIGVPLAKYGIKKGLAKNVNNGNLEGYVKRGYFKQHEAKEPMGQETVYSGNMDTMTFHFAVIGICFLMAFGMSEAILRIPVIGPSIGGLVFIYGMISAYIVKFVMKKLKIEHLLDNRFQSKITGWSTDYLVVTSFMAVQFSVIADWAIPILIVSIFTILVTFIIVVYFGQRFGGEDDFSRTLGLFGSAMGTVPSGLALVRIVDPSLRANTGVELGLMNVPMTIATIFTISAIMPIASGALSLQVGLVLLLAPIIVYLTLLKILGLWGKKSYEL